MSLPVEIVGKATDLSDWFVIAAAWAQALLSAGAILAAYFLGKHDRDERIRQTSQAHVSALAVIIFRAEAVLREPWDAISANRGFGFIETMTGAAWDERARQGVRCAAALADIPLHELGDWELVSAVLEMRESLDAGMPVLRDMRVGNQSVHMYPDQARIDLGALQVPLNLAGRAAARIHTRAHKLSSNPEAKKMVISPTVVSL